ncbi:MAG: hypothetical protein ACOYLF_17585, partial [Blastocatellia bacterium]
SKTADPLLRSLTRVEVGEAHLHDLTAYRAELRNGAGPGAGSAGAQVKHCLAIHLVQCRSEKGCGMPESVGDVGEKTQDVCDPVPETGGTPRLIGDLANFDSVHRGVGPPRG